MIYNIIIAGSLILAFSFIAVNEGRINELENHVDILAHAIKNQQYITDVLTGNQLK